MKLVYFVDGSRGDEYVVTITRSGSVVNALCTCAAGQNGSFCRHRVGILTGDMGGVIPHDDNKDDLATLLQGSALADALARYQDAEAAVDAAQAEFAKVKKALSRVMYARK